MEADVEFQWPDSGREKVVEDYRFILWVRLDDVEKYGLEYCLYFQTLRYVCRFLFFMSIAAIFLIIFALEGSQFSNNDLCSRFARTTMGNVGVDTALAVGTLDVRLDSTSGALGITVLVGVQLVFPALALLLLSCFAWPRLAGHPDLTSEPSVADYALEVFGIPDSALESEIVSHFEELLRGSSFDGLVCDVAVARDFRGALLEAMEAGPNTHQKHERAQEHQRPVFSTFIVLGSEAERNWLMRGFRWQRWIRCFQPRSKRFCRKWPLYFRAAPEPCDLQWAHYLDGRYCGPSLTFQPLIRCCTFATLLLLLSTGSCISALLWWPLLGHLGSMSMQCTNWSETTAGSCNCFCFCESSSCDEWSPPVGILAQGLLAAIFQQMFPRVIQWTMKWWRCNYRSRQEGAWMITTALAHSCAALSPVLGLWGLKLLWAYQLVKSPSTFADPKWQMDLSFYLYGLPVIVIWCICRWLAVIIDALRLRAMRWTGQRFILWRQYASLVSTLAVTIIFQPAAPILTPLATLGLLARYWCEKSSMLRGASVRCGTPVRLALYSATTAAGCLWIATIFACGLFLAVLWQGPGHSLSSEPAVASLLFVAFLVGAPLLLWTIRGVLWMAFGFGDPPGTSRPLVYTKQRKAPPNRMSFHEAWLIMRHQHILYSYSIADNPDFNGLLQKLRPELAELVGREEPNVRTLVGRSIDVTCSRAVVQEAAPTRASAAA